MKSGDSWLQTLTDMVRGAPEDAGPPDLPDLEIISKLGHGAMGSVWLAEDRVLHRSVAIKMLASNIADDEAARKRFLREARAMAAIDHDNVVTVHSFGEVDGRIYLVMQYIDGETLGERMARKGALSVDESVAILRQVVEALDASWNEGVVHRDIKPSNILIDQKGRVRVADFGLARTLNLADDSELTTAGTTMGTPHYISPEQVRGETVDFRADVYSLGVVLYEMLAGFRPFGGSPGEVMSKHLHEAMPALPEEAGLPMAIGGLVEAMTGKTVDARPESYTALLELIDGIAAAPDASDTDGQSAETVAIEAAPRRKAPQYMSAWRRSDLALGIAAVVGVGLYAALIDTVYPAAAVRLEIDRSVAAHLAGTLADELGAVREPLSDNQLLAFGWDQDIWNDGWSATLARMDQIQPMVWNVEFGDSWLSRFELGRTEVWLSALSGELLFFDRDIDGIPEVADRSVTDDELRAQALDLVAQYYAVPAGELNLTEESSGVERGRWIYRLSAERSARNGSSIRYDVEIVADHVRRLRRTVIADTSKPEQSRIPAEPDWLDFVGFAMLLLGPVLALYTVGTAALAHVRSGLLMATVFALTDPSLSSSIRTWGWSPQYWIDDFSMSFLLGFLGAMGAIAILARSAPHKLLVTTGSSRPRSILQGALSVQRGTLLGAGLLGVHAVVLGIGVWNDWYWLDTNLAGVLAQGTLGLGGPGVLRFNVYFCLVLVLFGVAVPFGLVSTWFPRLSRAKVVVICGIGLPVVVMGPGFWFSPWYFDALFYGLAGLALAWILSEYDLATTMVATLTFAFGIHLVAFGRIMSTVSASSTFIAAGIWLAVVAAAAVLFWSASARDSLQRISASVS